MPIPLAPITISAGVPQTVSIGTSGTAGAVVIGNESPFALMASGGSGGIWVYAQMADRLNCDTSAFNGNITLTAQNYLSNSTQAPSFQVYLTIYAPGEPIPGTYPCALSRMFNVGNSIVSNSPANVFEQDLFTPFVATGYVATKDGVISNQLDVTAGIAFLRQSVDNSLLRIANNATAFLTTTPTTTYFLDLNPDGSWSFATTHSGMTNHLSIAQATTDGSGNILAVTDTRTLSSTLLSAMAGDLAVPNALFIGGLSGGHLNASSNALGVWTPQSGAARVVQFLTWNGTALQIPLSLGSTAVGAQSTINDTGAISQLAGQASVGSFGVPVIVAQAMNVAVTTTAQTIVLSFTPSATGMYRASLHYLVRNTGSNNLTARVSWTDPTLGTSFNVNFVANSNLTPLDGSHAVGGTIPLATMPISFNAKTGQTIQVYVQDPTNTPNDLVSVLIERLI